MKFEEEDDLGGNFGEQYIRNTATEEKAATTKKRKNPEKWNACYDITRGMTVLDNANPSR